MFKLKQEHTKVFKIPMGTWKLLIIKGESKAKKLHYSSIIVNIMMSIRKDETLKFRNDTDKDKQAQTSSKLSLKNADFYSIREAKFWTNFSVVCGQYYA